MGGKEADEITVYVTSFGTKAASGECLSCQSHLFLLNPVLTTRNILHHVAATAAGCSKLIACSTQKDLALREQESRT